MDIDVTATIPGGPLYTVDGVTYEMPQKFDATVTGVHNVPYVVRVSVEVLPTGPRAFAVELEQLRDERGRPDGPYVTGVALRALALDGLIARATERAVAVADAVEVTAHGRSGALRTPTSGERASFVRAARARRPADDDERHALVRDTYREAMVLGIDPTRAVAEALGVARSTAGRYVSQARQHGYLRPAPGPRMAGEIEEDRS